MGENLRRVRQLILKQALIGLLVTVGCQIGIRESYSQENSKMNSCPSDVETLTDRMLKDLPSYANRVIQREGLRNRPFPPSLYVIVAGRPEFEPLPLSNPQHQPFAPETAQQVFFTTLERQYGARSVVDLENYYWLFLALTEEGWRSVLLFSQLASLNDGDLPLPPQDATDGAIGQGIRLWLRDCRAGVLKIDD